VPFAKHELAEVIRVEITQVALVRPETKIFSNTFVREQHRGCLAQAIESFVFAAR
jgi:hypothetical protein